MNIGQEQQILVEVGAMEFCIDLNEVISIITPPKMVRLPAARGAFTRAFKYLDELGAAVSVRAKFELEERQDLQSGQLLLGRINERLAGFWFDRVVGIHKLGDDMQVYDDTPQLQLPVSEVDQLFVYKQRLIPHISLSGLLRFNQATEWKQWLETEKPELERRMREAELAEQARLDAQKAEKEKLEPARQAPLQKPAPLTLEELYLLMDEAGVVVTASSESVEYQAARESIPESADVTVIAAEAVVTDSPVVEEVSVTEVETAAGIAPQPSGDEAGTTSDVDQHYSLAVPVTGEEKASATGQVEDEPAESRTAEPEGDALFALEKKSEAYRQRMDAEQQVDLTDYQIIKVGDRGLIRWLRRWMRRLLMGSLLLLLVMLTVVTYDYVGLYGDPRERVYIQNAQGEVDWSASYAGGRDELKRYVGYIAKRVQQRLHRPK